MSLNTFGFSTPRALALGTVAVTIGLGVASGVFSTFYATLQSGQTCAPGYGYDNSFGYGYGYGDASGYDCVPTPVVPTPSGGGGGGGGGGSSSSSSASTGTPVVILPPSVTPVVIIVAKDLSKSPFKTAIETLIQAGIMNNVVTTAPNQNVTRAEFMKLLSLANGYKSPVVVTKRFRDLPKANSLVNYVNYGVAMGWVNVKNTNFRPNDIITQGEIDKLIAAIKKTATADTVVLPSSGVSRGKAASDIVAAFFSK